MALVKGKIFEICFCFRGQLNATLIWVDKILAHMSLRPIECNERINSNCDTFRKIIKLTRFGTIVTLIGMKMLYVAPVVFCKKYVQFRGSMLRLIESITSTLPALLDLLSNCNSFGLICHWPCESIQYTVFETCCPKIVLPFSMFHL